MVFSSVGFEIIINLLFSCLFFYSSSVRYLRLDSLRSCYVLACFDSILCVVLRCSSLILLISLTWLFLYYFSSFSSLEAWPTRLSFIRVSFFMASSFEFRDDIVCCWVYFSISTSTSSCRVRAWLALFYSESWWFKARISADLYSTIFSSLCFYR